MEFEQVEKELDDALKITRELGDNFSCVLGAFYDRKAPNDCTDSLTIFANKNLGISGQEGWQIIVGFDMISASKNSSLELPWSGATGMNSEQIKESKFFQLGSRLAEKYKSTKEENK